MVLHVAAITFLLIDIYPQSVSSSNCINVLQNLIQLVMCHFLKLFSDTYF